MIGQLKGTVTHSDKRYIVLLAGHVGYRVNVTAETLEKLAKKKEEVMLWTHMAVRENAHDLYGFLTHEELGCFELLITVSGIGPKTALGILNIVSISTLRSAIARGEAGELTKVSGIGKKNAEKIIIELKDKLVSGDEDTTNFKDESDAVEALSALGYSQREARDALKKIPKTILGTPEKIREALRQLSSK
ncbi:Holliday junction branch migration protein RuvA [Candidatus Parcubacteria bacterium]|nr:Holliday junction branch migration protein RuvA [Candidatus Parcubacteria bacterium]